MFLDNEPTQEYFLRNREGEDISSLKRGKTVMIGQMWTNELAEVLMAIYPSFLEQDFIFEDLSRLLQKEIDENPWD